MHQSTMPPSRLVLPPTDIASPLACTTPSLPPSPHRYYAPALAEPQESAGAITLRSLRHALGPSLGTLLFSSSAGCLVRAARATEKLVLMVLARCVGGQSWALGRTGLIPDCTGTCKPAGPPWPCLLMEWPGHCTPLLFLSCTGQPSPFKPLLHDSRFELARSLVLPACLPVEGGTTRCAALSRSWPAAPRALWAA